MKKIDFKNSRFEVQRGVQLTDGRIVPVVGLNNRFVVKFGTPFNLETGEIYETPNEFSTDLNEQIEKGAKEVCCYDEFDLYLGERPYMDEKKIQSIIKKFAKKGFNVTKDAILHNYSAWRGDLKSGYRDEKNGYHLFSPCGCNPFSLHATTLHDSCSDWQTTYEF